MLELRQSGTMMLADRGAPAWRTCLAGMPFGEVEGGGRCDTPTGLPDALVVPGECGDRLPLLRSLVLSHLRA